MQCSVMPCLLNEGAHESPPDGERLHNENQIPVDQRPIGVGVPLLHVQIGVGDCSTEDCDVRQGHRVLSAELQDEHVDRDQDASASNAARRGDHESEGARDERGIVPPAGAIEGKGRKRGLSCTYACSLFLSRAA